MQTPCLSVWCVQSHMQSQMHPALHNVVSSHMKSDVISDAHMLNNPSVLIQAGWCKTNQFGKQKLSEKNNEFNL